MLLVEVLLTLRAMRMMRLVRLRLRTSLLVEALETTSRAVANSGASSWAAARARIHYTLDEIHLILHKF